MTSASENGRASEASAGLVSFSNNSEKKNLDISAASSHEGRMHRKRRGVLASARAIHNDLLERGFEQWVEGQGAQWSTAAAHEFRCALLTLTYAPEVKWSAMHIASLLDHYRKWAKRNKCIFAYVWVMEPHESGVPHYHMVFWVTGGKFPPFPDAQGWWPHGMSNAVWAHSPVGYIAKYCSKATSDKLPKGARLYGAGGLSLKARAERSWALAPKWLRQMTAPGTLLTRKKITVLESAPYGHKRLSDCIAWVEGVFKNAFFSPWESTGWTPQGVSLRHRGFVEMFTPDGDYFRIPHVNPYEVTA